MLENYYNFHITTISATGWFLPAMFFTELLFVIISNIVSTKKRTWVLYMAFVATGFIFLDYNQTPLLLTLDVVPFTLGFLSLGFLFKQQFTESGQIKTIYIILMVGFVIMWYWLPVSANIRVSYYNPKYTAWLVCLLVSCAIIYIIRGNEAIIKQIPFYKWISEVGKSTIVIYLLHGEILRILPFKSITLNSTFATTICQLFITAIIIMITVLVARFINRFLPWSLGKF